MPFQPPFQPDPTCFPNLSAEGFVQTSPRDTRYNCIAWAAGEERWWWWPARDAKWPAGVPLETTIEAFTAAFATMGYEPCDNSNLEVGYEKVAFYANANGVQHAARQLPSGFWTSKLGRDADVQHTLEGLAGPCYGTVQRFLRRVIVTAQSTPR
jgi:hypothetical protein